MMISYLYILLPILHRIATAAVATPPAYTATDLILLNCGESTQSQDVSNRSWNGDAGSSYLPPNGETASSASPASYMHPAVFPIPYETARVFQSPFTYSFPVSPGCKFLRLYFYPEVYSGFDTSHSLFSVAANHDFTLLSNFSASLYSKNTSQPSFIKEFVVSVEENQRLNLTFSPNSSSFAFVNGIEIVSMPENLYFRGAASTQIGSIHFHNVNDTVLEKVYRLNVGGAAVDIENDSGPSRGMFREWLPDDDYIFGTDYGYTAHREVRVNYSAQTPPYVAPALVYTTARVMGNSSRSLDWSFPVDSGFHYLLRLHFCEFTQDVRGENQRVFTVNINNFETIDKDNDVVLIAGGVDIPIFKDYVAWVPDDGRGGKEDLWLALLPYVDPRAKSAKYFSAILNGLEVFKLSDESRSLAAANPEFDLASSSPPAREESGKSLPASGKSYVVYIAVWSVTVGVAVVAVLVWWKLKASTTKSVVKSPSLVSLRPDSCRCFCIKEIKTATSNFDDSLIVGRGGFGNVYKGLLHNPPTTVAVKRCNPSSHQGAREFLTEIEMLSKLRHRHLVSLIGYCNDDGEMILVYDYMARGTLRDHLYDSRDDRLAMLAWMRRLQICLGAARGLEYLHNGARSAIIHRDVKSTNILLDEKWTAKVSDFGLSKFGPTDGLRSHVTTAVKGSFGYVDPEYYRRQQLTNKSDVYSFGVVLFEVLCARPAVLPSLPIEQVNLAEWAKFCFKEGRLEQIIDSNLKSQIAPRCLSKFVETAVACLGENGTDRPSMNDVVRSLEVTIKLQLAADGNGNSDAFVVATSNMTPGEVLSSSEIEASTNNDFSEIMNPIGR